MKIIKQGRLPEKRVWQGECYNCHTVAEAEQGELRGPLDQRDAGLVAPCPMCRKQMTFYPEEDTRAN